ncbi:hypothetical protein BOX15_Mlig001265g10 [Macrostomum lignano]|uniref:RNA-directed DNA polymerase n=1 Tax=Macrostomum lignano TaxID=282301 RepID=A0A267DAG3_9PLAT|nr:hypothetical protein BOX15_Mlig001265g10 [Macrostomum lignano]
MDGSLSTANGGAMRMRGCIVLDVEIGGERWSANFFVVDGLRYDVILGSEFFKQHRCVINYSEFVFRVGDVRVPIRQKGELPVVCRIKAETTVFLEPAQEVVMPARVEKKGARNCGSVGITEEKPVKAAEKDLAMARALVAPGVDGRLPMRLLNTSSCRKRVKKGETIGWFIPLEPNGGINVVRLDDDVEAKNEAEAWDPIEEFREWGSCGLSEEEEADFRELISQHRAVFAKDSKDLGCTTVMKHEIDTGDARPVKEAARRIPPYLRQEVDKELDDLLEAGRISEVQSPWCSPVVCVKKKDGSLRFCCDYRKLNEVTKKDAVPLPRTDDLLESLGDAKIFSTMDMQSGYWQMAVEPSDRLKTAFGVSHRVQQYAWNVMPFGLTNAPASFSRLMNVVLGKLCWKTCLVYLDDLLVWSRTVEEHLERLQTVFRRLRAANIKLKPKKCAFLLKSVTFLGHVVSADGIATSPEKIAEIRDWPTPKNVKEVRSFLGLCGYYRQFIADFSRIAEPMLRRTRHDCPWSWDEECQAAFEALKERLQGSEVMAFPNFAEDAGEFVLDTDGSTKEGIGAVLSQVQKDGSEKVIAYGSRTLSREERNYCTTRVELLAVVFFVQKFRYYLMGREFLVRTDHSSLKWLHSLRDVEGQLARWLELLAPYRYRIEHRPGVKHQHADALSRKPRRRHQGSESCPGCAQEQIGVNALGLQKWTSEEIRESQKMDSDIRQAMELLAHGDGEITEEHLRRISPTARRIVERRRDLEVSDSEVLLCHTVSRRQPKWCCHGIC